jgi:high-affinity iron transporter
VYETLLITFREGLEAFLMVAVATLFLRKTGRGALVMAVRSGLGVSIVGSVLLGVLLARVGSMSPLWEGILALLAAAAVVWCVTHMRKMGRHMGSEIASGLGKASVLDGPRAWWAVSGFLALAWLIEYRGISTTTSVCAKMAWQLSLEWGSRPQARSSRSSSLSSSSFSESKPSRTTTWQVVQAQLRSQACSI